MGRYTCSQDPYDPRKSLPIFEDGVLTNQSKENKMDSSSISTYTPANTAPRSSSIRDNRDRAHAEMEVLFATIQDLKEVLSPILSEEPNEKRGDNPEAPANSSLGSSLHDIASGINRASVQLSELRHRIDL